MTTWAKRNCGSESYILAQDGSFLTFQDGSQMVWSNQTYYNVRTRPSTNYTNRETETENYILNQDGSFLNFQDGSLVVWSNRVQWDWDRLREYLLQEDACLILLEDGSKIMVTGDSLSEWGCRTKPTTVWVNRVLPS